MFFIINGEYNMTHQCKVQCHSMDIKTAEDLGIEDAGKWLPFIFNMEIVDAAKLASDEEDSSTYNCTSIYTTTGNTYIIDTPYEEFFKKFLEFNTIQIVFGGSPDDKRGEENEDDDDIQL